ncbi:Hypp3788 [Branchiostoma lanceolatum]|uniref:Hypp3788 protein n=1 Tax=Branchiostoma lanceolatum TaxID=7740 RepID=A0A8K0A1Y5_BRALA|nr:Hypp3788 [Branchiostoma lanceolatum]
MASGLSSSEREDREIEGAGYSGRGAANGNVATTAQKQGTAQAVNDAATSQKQCTAEASPRQQPEEDTPRPTLPIIPVLAQVRPVLLPIAGTNMFTPVWDGSEKAQIMLQMIMAAKREVGLY